MKKHKRFLAEACTFIMAASINGWAGAGKGADVNMGAIKTEFKGPITTLLTQVDISPLLSGNQTDLYVVLIGSAQGAHSAQRSVPVTFRHS